MQLVAAARVIRYRLQRTRAVTHFANRHAAGILIQKGTETLQERNVFRPRLVVEMLLHPVRIDVGRIRGGCPIVGKMRRIAAQMTVVEIIVHGVETEAVHTAIEPELHGLKQRVLNLRVVEVEVRL